MAVGGDLESQWNAQFGAPKVAAPPDADLDAQWNHFVTTSVPLGGDRTSPGAFRAPVPAKPSLTDRIGSFVAGVPQALKLAAVTNPIGQTALLAASPDVRGAIGGAVHDRGAALNDFLGIDPAAAAVANATAPVTKQDAANLLAAQELPTAPVDANPDVNLLRLQNIVQNANQPGSAGRFDPMLAGYQARQARALAATPTGQVATALAQADTGAPQSLVDQNAHARDATLAGTIGSRQLPELPPAWMTDPDYSANRLAAAFMDSFVKSNPVTGLPLSIAGAIAGDNGQQSAAELASPTGSAIGSLGGIVAGGGLARLGSELGLGAKIPGIAKWASRPGIAGRAARAVEDFANAQPFASPIALQAGIAGYQQVADGGGTPGQAFANAFAQGALADLMFSVPMSARSDLKPWQAASKTVRAAAKTTVAGINGAARAVSTYPIATAMNYLPGVVGNAIAPDQIQAPTIAESAELERTAPMVVLGALFGHGVDPRLEIARAIQARAGAIRAAREPIPATDAGTPEAGTSPPTSPSTGDAKLDATANALRDIGAKNGMDVDAEAARIRAGAPDTATSQPTAQDAAIDTLLGGNHPETPEGSTDTANDHPVAQIRDTEREPTAPKPVQPAPERVASYYSALADEIGWDQIGGRIIRDGSESAAGVDDALGVGPDPGRAGGQVVGRTQWIGKPAATGEGESNFWRMRPANARLSEAQAREAFRKEAAGEKLKPVEQRFIDYAHETAREYAQAEAEETAYQAELDRQLSTDARVQDDAALRNAGAGFTLGENDAAARLFDIVHRAEDAGVPNDRIGETLMLADDPAHALTMLIEDHQHGTQPQTDAVDLPRVTEAAGAGDRTEPHAATAADSRGSQGAQNFGGQLFAGPTAADQLRAAAGAKDAERNGLNRRAPTPDFFGTDLGATPHGEAPEQTTLPESGRVFTREVQLAKHKYRVTVERSIWGGGRYTYHVDRFESFGGAGDYFRINEHKTPPSVARLGTEMVHEAEGRTSDRPEQGRIDEPKRSEPADAQTTDSGVPQGLPVAQTDATRRLARAINRPVRVGRSDKDPARFREVDSHSLPDALSRALKALERFGNLKVHVIRNLNADESGVRFNGVTMQDGHLYVDERAEAPAVTIAIHEFLHQLKRDAPDLYQQLVDEIERQAREDPDKSSAWVKEATRRGYKAAEAREELVGDATGDALSDPAFLRRMAERNPSAFRDMAQRFIEFINKFLGSARDLGSNQYLTDVAAFRDKLADVLDTYARERVQDVSMPRRGTLDVRPGDPDYQRVFHGGPYRDIEKNGGFKLNKIGTGEGSQAYGWGVYFAGRREIAEHYRKQLSGKPEILFDGKPIPQGDTRKLWAPLVAEHGKAGALRELDELARANRASGAERFARELEAMKSEVEHVDAARITERAGQLYHAEIPEDHELLDWDRPLSEQPAAVRKALRNVEGGDSFREALQPFEDTTGDGLYRALTRDLGSPRAASEALSAAGIPGLRYLDGGSRGVQRVDVVTRTDGSHLYIAHANGKTRDFPTRAEADAYLKANRVAESHNYVIWDEARLNNDVTPYYSRRTDDQTDTPAFRHWFKDSKAVDAEGKPLTVYHGTSEDFNAFDNAKLGANTGHMTSPLGHFLTEDRRSAKAYADKAAGYVEPDSRVIDAHLSMQHPKEMTGAEFQAIDSFDDARALRAKLEHEGYDGIHIPEYKQWVAFKPEQIKSASQNRGTFDPNNSDIRFSRRASAEDKRADREYLDAVNRGDMERANAIVAAAAKKSGYAPSNDFRMNHQAPGPGEYNLADVRESHVVPDDYWTLPSDYLVPEEMEAHGALVAAMRRADARRAAGKSADLTGMTVYRAVPKNVKEGDVRNGDWVTPSLQYAKSEGANIPGGYRVIRQHVLLKHLWWDGNSPAELGYHDGRDLAYRNTRNNSKLLDTVTRDDEGNIIPPSQRFNTRKDDVRFSRKASDAQGDHAERTNRALAPRDDVGTERRRATDNANVEPPNPADEPPTGTPRAPGESLKAYGARIIREGRETMLQGVMRDHGMRLLDAEGRATKLEGRGMLRAYMAGIQRTMDTAEQQFKAAMKVFDGFSRRENLDAIHQWETKQEVTSAPHRLFFAVMDKAFKARIEAIRKIDPEALQSLIENYFPHLWKDPTRAAKWYASQLARRPLQGDRAFLKQRVYATIREGMASGLEPISANPVDLFLGKLTQMDKFIAFGKLRGELDGMGWLPKLKNDERVPYGYARVENGAFNGVVVPETLAKDINNYLSPGFNGNKAFRALRWTQNTLTMAQLGWSGFHAGFTTFDNAVLHAEVGLRRALMGDFSGAFHDWLHAPLSIVASPIEGGALNRSWVDVASGAVDGKFDAMAKFFGVDRHDMNTLAILDALEQGGARWKMSRSDYTNDLNQFLRAFRQKDVKGSLRHVLGAFGEAGSFYIHHVLVPNQKMAARVLLAKYELDRLAGVFNKHGNADVSAGDYKAIIDAMDPTALRQVMGKVVHDVDSRLGQMAYDNLFWNRAVIQIGQTAFRALGWQIGTVGTVTGGLRDLRRLWSPEKLLSPLDKGGKIADADMGRVTGRTSYLLTLAIVSGMSNALLQYALTGQLPSEPKDFFFPRTGRKNADGSDERLQLPSYWMDHWKIATHPLETLGHKINPLFELLAEPMRNQDFWGAQIRDPHAKWDEQAAQLGKYWAAQFLPFTFSNGQKVAENGGKMGRQIANFFGVTNAPASVTRSDFQAFVGHNGNKGFGHEMRSQVDLEHSRAVHQAEAAIRQGDTPDMTGMTPRDRKRIAREVRSEVPELEFRKMDIEDKLQGWDMATPKERVDYNLRRDILMTAQNAIHTDRFMRLPEDQRQAIYAKLREIRNQPNATQ